MAKNFGDYIWRAPMIEHVGCTRMGEADEDASGLSSVMLRVLTKSSRFRRTIGL
jgi:hypothetical protein